MMKTDKHIEIVSSTKVGLSSMSQKSREAIKATLSEHYTSVVITIINDLEDLKALVRRKPDLVFLGMKFIPLNPELGQFDPNKTWVAQYLDEWGINYTGSSQAAHELELNKQLAKQQVIDSGLCTSPFRLIKKGQAADIEDSDLTYPLFVKPANRGGGLGIDQYSVAENAMQLQAKITSIATKHQSDSLVENYLSGREFSVAILKNEYRSGYAVMPLELVTESADGTPTVLSSSVKSSNTEIILPVTDSEIRASICTLALAVFHALGARDYGRIDIRMNALGTPHFLEANLIPSLIADYGSFPKACVLNKELEYQTMILAIVSLAFSRDVKPLEVIKPSIFIPTHSTVLLPN